MLDVPALMTRLAIDRPVFHSEADFQHALAWTIHTLHPSARIRLERRFDGEGTGARRAIYLDLWIQIGDHVTAIELKYQTRAFRIEVEGEVFDLRTQGAEDNLGYDFFSDLARLERFVEAHPGAEAHAILLGNEPPWNNKPGSREFNNDAFRIHDGRELNGTLSWRDPGRAKERAAALEIRETYTAQWRDYCDVGGTSGLFRYLWFPVVPTGSSSPATVSHPSVEAGFP